MDDFSSRIERKTLNLALFRLSGFVNRY